MVTLSITNMTCGGCVKGVAATLLQAAPEQVPQFHLERREVVLSGDPTRLIAALRADGWDASLK